MGNHLIIRSEMPSDLPAIRNVNRLAFGRPDEANLVDALRPSLASTDYSQVAVLNSEVVGHILFSPIVIDSGLTSIPALALAPMAVLPERQGQGIGSALVQDGLAVCQQMGDRIVIVLGHSDFYPRFGFQPASRFNIRAPFEVPDPAFMALELQPGALQAVQGTVRYPAAFDAV
jgi:putative acetyltransferase